MFDIGPLPSGQASRNFQISSLVPKHTYSQESQLKLKPKPGPHPSSPTLPPKAQTPKPRKKMYTHTLLASSLVLFTSALTIPAFTIPALNLPSLISIPALTVPGLTVRAPSTPPPMPIQRRATYDVICRADVFQNPEEDIPQVACMADAKCQGGDMAVPITDAQGAPMYQTQCFGCPTTELAGSIVNGCSYESMLEAK
ncbi:hypothetical protein LZ554_004723 [Drepanopeziza brunnea f. sp. 'monogermtubi']|nr:hypothetical protein LZ554_004723 [Drepanopeziza brunnea f. sp. 'monogermtubi']